MEGLEEGVRHAPSDEHLIHLVQQVLDQLNLVMDLCTIIEREEEEQWGRGGEGRGGEGRKEEEEVKDQ